MHARACFSAYEEYDECAEFAFHGKLDHEIWGYLHFHNESMKQLEIINPERVSQEESDTYRVREAARAIVVDADNNVALLFVSQKNYYKLPGGGVDEGEEKLEALARECQEEIGCKVALLGEVGIVVEYRKIFCLKQISYCYVARVIGEKGAPDFTESESENGFEIVWLPYVEALAAVSTVRTTDFEGGMYISPRDTVLLRNAQELLAMS